MKAAAESNLKRVGLELGGKSPLVICDDFDVDEAVDIAHAAIFNNHGQNCCAGSRTFVQAGIYDKFVTKAKAKAEARKVGDPWMTGVEHGPLVDKSQFDKVLEMVKSGQDQGAHLQCGGTRAMDKGYFVKPTVFSGMYYNHHDFLFLVAFIFIFQKFFIDVKDNMRIAKEEIFGPVQSIFKFSSMEEMIERANNTNYGLASGILTKDINKAMMFAQAIQAGSVWINCYDAVMSQTPFGGFKQSGIGRELGPEGIHEYIELKTVTIAIPQKNS